VQSAKTWHFETDVIKLSQLLSSCCYSRDTVTRSVLEWRTEL